MDDGFVVSNFQTRECAKRFVPSWLWKFKTNEFVALYPGPHAQPEKTAWYTYLHAHINYFEMGGEGDVLHNGQRNCYLVQ